MPLDKNTHLDTSEKSYVSPKLKMAASGSRDQSGLKTGSEATYTGDQISGLDKIDSYKKIDLNNYNVARENINKIRDQENQKEMIFYGGISFSILLAFFLIFYFFRKQKSKLEIERKQLLQAEIQKKIEEETKRKNDISIDWVVNKS